MAEVPRIPLSVPDLRGDEGAYLGRCVADNWVSSAGPFVTEMEDQMAALTGRRHGVATVNGSAALHLALIAAGVGEGDRVIVPDWTFAATANAVYHTGATPLFLDITAESWTLDPGETARALAEPGHGIAAVIAVHALGHPADMDPIREACAAAGAALIEDAAAAIGSAYRGRPAGSLGDLAIFSFNGNKTVTAGGGGMVVTDDGERAARMRSLSTQARAGADYRHDDIGYNYRMTNLNAAVGLAQLERLEEMVAAKRAIADTYDAALAGRPDLGPMPRAEWGTSNCWLYSVAAATVEDAGALAAHLDGRGIEARRFWRVLSEQKPFRDAPRRLTGVAAELSGRVVSLPSSSNLTPADQERVITALSGWRGTDIRGKA